MVKKKKKSLIWKKKLNSSKTGESVGNAKQTFFLFLALKVKPSRLRLQVRV